MQSSPTTADKAQNLYFSIIANILVEALIDRVYRNSVLAPPEFVYTQLRLRFVRVPVLEREPDRFKWGNPTLIGIEQR